MPANRRVSLRADRFDSPVVHSMNKTITNLVLEEEEGNYDSLSESQGAREESMEDDVESSTSFMNRPARNREEAERQLETLYQQQRARDRLSMDPSCDCTYCDELRSEAGEIDGLVLAVSRSGRHAC